MSKRIPVILGLLLMCLAVWILVMPTPLMDQVIDRLNNLGYDLQLRTRIITERQKPTTPIAIIDIDDKSLSAEGRWPWPRSKLATLVNRLEEYGAAVIAFDMFFAEKEVNVAEKLIQKLTKKNLMNDAVLTFLQSQQSMLDDDKAFAESLERVQAVLAVGFLPRPQKSNLLPPPLLKLSKEHQDELNVYRELGYISNVPVLQQAAKGTGFINIFPDSDGIIRRAPLLLQYENGIYPALSLEAVLLFLSEKISLVTPEYNDIDQLEGIQLGANMIPTDARGQVLIPFIGRSYTFPYYSATDVLHGRLPPDALLGKILFVGTSATGSGDLKATAIQNPFPGVEIQATLANGLLLNNFSYKPAWTFGANIVITILFGLIASFLFPHLGPRILSAIILFLPPTLLLLNNFIWVETGLIISFLVPVALTAAIAILNIIYGYLFETRKREHLKEMFGQYVPEKHIDEMLKTSSSYALGGEDREMTVLFADMRDFTSISENLSAKELVELLNTIFTPMTEIIFKHRGTIDKYVGDLIMAFWGAPLRDRNHARHALQSAIEMQSKLKTLRTTFSERGLAPIYMGIGLNSGVMSVGDMGSRFRRNYTVLGDAVNLASRVESLSKYYGVDIIATEKTVQNQNRFVFRKLDRVRVKGKQDSTMLYEVIGLHSHVTPEMTQELTTYQTALDYYFAQEWDDALAILQQLSTLHPDKKIYQIYIERISEFKKRTMPDDWDGVYEHAMK